MGYFNRKSGEAKGSHLSKAMRGMKFNTVDDIPVSDGRAFNERGPTAASEAEREPTSDERWRGSCPTGQKERGGRGRGGY